jgi:hypothetical protein
VEIFVIYRGEQETQRLHGMAPPLSDASKSRRTSTIFDDGDDDLDQHDDGSSVLLGYADDDVMQSHDLWQQASPNLIDLPLMGRSPNHEEVQRDFELSRDIGELLYGSDDTYNADDDDKDLLTYYLRKREVGFKAMANFINVHDNSDGAIIGNMGEDHDDHIQEDDNFDGVEKEEDDEKDSIWNHRPKQNRTGVLWEGWPDKTKSSHWWRQSRMCFEVDHICHRRSNNTWFYYESKQPKSDSFQPSMQLRCEPLRYDRGLIANEMINITVDASSRAEGVTFVSDHSFQFSSISSFNDEGGTCKISSIPTHMTVQSMFNYMIGEFYARTILPLYRLMNSYTSQSNKPDNLQSPMPWEEDIQFYVHLSHGNQKLYDGHKLLLNGMLSTTRKNSVDSMVDMFTSDGTNEDDCQCYEKLVFCGYDTYINTTDNHQSEDNLTVNTERVEVENTELTPDLNTHYTVWGSSTTGDDIDRRGHCGKGEISLDLYSCDDWAELRYFLASNFKKRFPSLKSDITNFRRDSLIEMGFIDDSYTGDTREWKFVGLAQRSYRRSWINLPKVRDKCNALYGEKKIQVACIEVNVENTTTPYEQLLLHQSVDALFGVHGAQLTQAVLLPPHGHVLELLPWVTDYIRGSWVQTRHIPTPLGIIFHNTDLYHSGYSLERDSVPMCEDAGEVGSEEEKDCFLSKGNKMVSKHKAMSCFIINFISTG